MLALGNEPRILSVILAGGEGKRLAPLTLDRAKPAVPFGGHYRLIDFSLSNLTNAGYYKIVVLTQYKSHSLDVHVSRTWRLSSMLGNYVTSVPAQMRSGKRWFLGSDHIYRIDPRQMLEQHIESDAGVTVSAIRADREKSDQFGVIETDGGSKITSFLEKPSAEKVAGLPGHPDQILASMGNYVFKTDALVDPLHEDQSTEGTGHDVGGDLIPMMVERGDAHVYDFTENRVPGQLDRPHHWRDVGTIDSYFDAHMDLVDDSPAFDLQNTKWPIYSYGRSMPPAKVVDDDRHGSSAVHRSLLSNGVVVAGARVVNSVLSPGVRIEPGALVENAVLLDDVVVGSGARVSRSVLDKNTMVQAGASVGLEFGESQQATSEGGVVVVAKNSTI